jgi:hypothetical protein
MDAAQVQQPLGADNPSPASLGGIFQPGCCGQRASVLLGYASHHTIITTQGWPWHNGGLAQAQPLTCVGMCKTINVMWAVTGSRRHGCSSGAAATTCCCTRSIHSTTLHAAHTHSTHSGSAVILWVVLRVPADQCYIY